MRSAALIMTFAVVGLLDLAPAAAFAAGPQPTSLRLAVPASGDLGGSAQVQAQLLDAAGKPVAGAVVLFSEKLAFLEAAGNVVVADAITDKAGIANTDIDLRSEGTIDVTAAFKGDAQNAPSSTSASIAVVGSAQLYAQSAGVKLPGLNEPPGPAQANAALFETVSALWPAMSGWPIALALMTIWSLYASVVFILFRIVRTTRPATADAKGKA